MLLKILKSKIHGATVTRSDLNYEGSISVDECLMEGAGLVAYESVHVWNITNGERLETYVLPAVRESGEICLNGAAARKGQTGDLIIIASFCGIDVEKVPDYAPKIILVDRENRAITGQRLSELHEAKLHSKASSGWNH